MKNGSSNGRDIDVTLLAEQERTKRCSMLCAALFGSQYHMSFMGEESRKRGTSKPTFTFVLRGKPKDKVKVVECSIYQGPYEREGVVRKITGGFFKLDNLRMKIESCVAETYDLRDVQIIFDTRSGYRGQ